MDTWLFTQISTKDGYWKQNILNANGYTHTKTSSNCYDKWIYSIVKTSLFFFLPKKKKPNTVNEI